MVIQKINNPAFSTAFENILVGLGNSEHWALAYTIQLEMIGNEGVYPEMSQMVTAYSDLFTGSIG